MADTGKPYNLIIPTEYNNDWYSAFVSLIQSIATVVGISEAQMSNCHDYKFLIQDINERLKSHIDSQDTVLDLKTALTKLDLGYGLNQLNVMWDALQFYHQREREFKRFMNEYDNVKGADIPALFSALSLSQKYPIFKARKDSVAQAIATTTWTKVTFVTVDINIDNYYDPSLSRFTPLKAGKYNLTFQIYWDIPVGTGQYHHAIYKNSSALIGKTFLIGNVGYHNVTGSYIVEANGTTDYFEIYVYHTQGADRSVSFDSVLQTFFSGFRIGV